MTDKQANPDEADSRTNPAQSLRERAEEISKKTKPHFAESWLPPTARELLHELRVHQIELEMQNEELRQKQEDMETSRAKYFDLYNFAPVGYFTINEAGLVTEANLTAANLLGMDRNLLVNQPFTRLIVSEDQDTYYLFRKKLIETGTPQVCELRIARPDGGRFCVVLRATVTEDTQSGEPTLHAVMSDITDRKRAENENARLANAVSHTADAVAITDVEGVVEYVNPAFEKITGYRLDEVRGQNLRLLKSGKQNREFYERLWETIKSGQVWRGHIVNRRKDGSLYEEKMTISSIADATGAIVNFVAVKRDETHEAALKKSRDYFTAIAAHELRTPLMKLHLLKNMLDQIQTATPVGGQVETANRVLLEAISSFDRIVNATGLISDMAMRGAERQFAREFIHNDVAEALESARANIAGARRDIRIEADISTLPHDAVVMGNRLMIQQALDETLSNAIKYTPDGRAILLRAHVSGGSAHIEVADGGEGIPEGKLTDLLIPYYSLEDPLNHSTGRYKFRGGGLGLGFTVVKLIMDYHNGSLSIGNRTDRPGALVVLSFPLAGEEAAQPH